MYVQLFTITFKVELKFLMQSTYLVLNITVSFIKEHTPRTTDGASPKNTRTRASKPRN